MTSTSIPQQRWTICEAQEQNPLACLLDYFPGGFVVEAWDSDFAKINTLEFCPTDEFTSAISGVGGAIPVACFWAWADHGALILPWAWLQVIEGSEYDAAEELEVAA